MKRRPLRGRARATNRPDPLHRAPGPFCRLRPDLAAGPTTEHGHERRDPSPHPRPPCTSTNAESRAPSRQTSTGAGDCPQPPVVVLSFATETLRIWPPRRQRRFGVSCSSRSRSTGNLGHRGPTILGLTLLAVLPQLGCDEWFGGAEEPRPSPPPRAVPDPEVQRVQISRIVPEGCTRLGEVSGTGSATNDPSLAASRARDSMRIRAHAVGANYVVLEMETGGPTRVEGTSEGHQTSWEGRTWYRKLRHRRN